MTRTRISRLFLACTLAILWCESGGPATAQEAEPGATEAAPGQTFSEELTVTARKREENLQEVPFSIVAPSGDVLRNRGVSNLVHDDPPRRHPRRTAALHPVRGANHRRVPARRSEDRDRPRRRVLLHLDHDDDGPRRARRTRLDRPLRKRRRRHDRPSGADLHPGCSPDRRDDRHRPDPGAAVVQWGRVHPLGSRPVLQQQRTELRPEPAGHRLRSHERDSHR